MIEDRNTLLEVEAYLNQIVHPFGFLMVEGNENKKLIDLKSNFQIADIQAAEVGDHELYRLEKEQVKKFDIIARQIASQLNHD